MKIEYLYEEIQHLKEKVDKLECALIDLAYFSDQETALCAGNIKKVLKEAGIIGEDKEVKP